MYIVYLKGPEKGKMADIASDYAKVMIEEGEAIEASKDMLILQHEIVADHVYKKKQQGIVLMPVPIEYENEQQEDDENKGPKA